MRWRRMRAKQDRRLRHELPSLRDRAWMRRGVPGDAFTGRPHIAIANTASDLTPCNAHLTEVAASVANGVYEAGCGLEITRPRTSDGQVCATARCAKGCTRTCR